MIGISEKYNKKNRISKALAGMIRLWSSNQKENKGFPMSQEIQNILGLLNQLKAAKITCSVRCTRDEAISIDVAVPGERWEIDFLEDGNVDIEIFRSDGTMYDQSKSNELFMKHAD